MNPTAMLFSPINPISIGLKAPPATPITIYDEAFLVRVPIFESPSAKIVGNMIDIKKKVVYRAYNDILPRARITRSMHTDEIKENKTSSLLGVVHFISILPESLPTMNKVIQPKARNLDAFSGSILGSCSVT